MTRTVHPSMPPKAEYSLTAMVRELHPSRTASWNGRSGTALPCPRPGLPTTPWVWRRGHVSLTRGRRALIVLA
ncbi:hypothetical protein [Streptomyces sp. SID12501]|uniref:hypothetical protein n=1 Tax=Streptomyces sp. SID12501 TaxID=2706042 RepID=UPI001EF38BE5|nr:hypothetical protein [Streptomyces sp. SID12501]